MTATGNRSRYRKHNLQCFNQLSVFEVVFNTPLQTTYVRCISYEWHLINAVIINVVKV